MTCSDYLPDTGTDCPREARWMVRILVGGNLIGPLPKCTNHAHRYRHKVGLPSESTVIVEPVE